MAPHSEFEIQCDPLIKIIHSIMSADESDDESIDEEQLDEYREMVENLGDFPDKVKISSLSMMAEDFSDSGKGSKAIYQIIRERLMTSSRTETLLPLVYLLDSILKNAKGRYIAIVEADAAKWLAHVFPQLPSVQKQKVQRMWKTWNDTKLFDDEKLQQMADCFVERSQSQENNGTMSSGVEKKMNSTTDPVAGISRTVCAVINFLNRNRIKSSNPMLNDYRALCFCHPL